MTKRVGLLGAWLLATLMLGFVGYGAVALVGDRVTDQPTGRVVNLSVTTVVIDRDFSPNSVAEEETAEAVDAAGAAAGEGQADDDDLTPAISEPEENTSTTATATTSTIATTTEPAATSPPATAAPPPPPPPSSTTTTTVPASTSTTSTSLPNDDPVTETGPFSFTSAGGVVTVTCVGDKVRFGGASPQGGASITVVDRGPQQVIVRFTSQPQVWTTEVECEDGAATAEFD